MPDQTFSRAIEAVHQPIQDHGPMMLSLACDQRKFVAYRHGPVGFTLNDQPSAAFDGKTHRGERVFPYQLHAVFGDGDYKNLTRRLDGGWLPMPVTSVDEEGVVYRTRSFVAPLDDEPIAGGPDWLRRRAACVVEYTIENTRAEAAEAMVVLSVLDDVKKMRRMALEPVDGGVVASLEGRLLVFIDTGEIGPLEAKTDAETTLLTGALPPGAKARCVAYLPAWKMPPAELATFRGQSDALAAKVKQYWNELLAPATQIELPDELLSNVIRASRVHIMLAAGNEENGSRIDAWTSADRYGALESESQPILRGMDMMGHRDFARRGLDFFIARYNKQGFLTTGYTMMGSGWHLWTLAEFVDRSDDLDWFKRVAPEVARMCRWIVEPTREDQAARTPTATKAPNHGLTPPGVVADWERFTNTTFQEAHYATGLREAARVLAKVDHPDAKALAAERRGVPRGHPAGVSLDAGPKPRGPAGRRHVGTRPAADLLHLRRGRRFLSGRGREPRVVQERDGAQPDGQSHHRPRGRGRFLDDRHHGGDRVSPLRAWASRPTTPRRTGGFGSTWVGSTSASPTTAASRNSTPCATRSSRSSARTSTRSRRC